MSGFRRICLAGAVMIALSAGVAFAQDQQQQITPGRILERLLQLGQNQQQPQTADAVVAGAGGWTQTGVIAQRGGQIEITATGQWSAFNQQRITAAGVASATDANGYQGRTIDNAPLPNANFGALIGRIGERGTPFLVGASYRGTANADGPLFLAMNDFNFEDNAGRLAAQVRFTPAPPRQPETPTQPPTQTEPPTRTPPATQTPETPTPETQEPETPPQQVEQPPINEPFPPADIPQATEPEAPSALPEPLPSDTEEPAAPGIPLATWIGLAIAAGLVVLALAINALRPRPRANRDAPPPLGVTTRIADDGIAKQKLSVTWKDGG